ncbi:peptide chain release factor N(5)-glutamine methyltransferase [Pelagibacterium sp.]|uniref:peptide chain release factor N(5)-glutamine methyltransferase n=1 Tax=Pelagibacterium sp. TaxID=1967288 RepID=UPI003A8C9ED8
MTQTIGQTWRSLRERFTAAGFATAALDARLLVRHSLGFDDTKLIAGETDPYPERQMAALSAYVDRRLGGEPIARIVGVQEFYGLRFGLNAATLIPRPETEMLVDFAIAELGGRAAPKIADLGTGTGCIMLSVLANLQEARGVGVDLSADALDQARINARTLGVAERFEGREGSWFEPLGGEQFDLVVSNPPYIASQVIETLAVGVKSFDPMLALDGGRDGLAPYRVIAAQGRAHLAAGGALALEIGFDQGQIVNELLDQAGFCDISIARDLAGHDRMVTARAPQ